MNFLDDCICNTYCFVCWWPLAYCQCYPQQPPIDVTEIIEAIMLVNATLQDIKTQAIITNEQISELREIQSGFNHWNLALAGLSIGLLVTLILATAWGKK